MFKKQSFEQELFDEMSNHILVNAVDEEFSTASKKNNAINKLKLASALLKEANLHNQAKNIDNVVNLICNSQTTSEVTSEEDNEEKNEFWEDEE